MTRNGNEYDVIIIGAGSMGTSACYQLAKRGIRVLGLEQFDRVHEFGSHTGQSRIIRKAYYEHADYVPLLRRSYELWKELELATRTKLYYKTGILYFGDQDDPVLKGVKYAADSYDVVIDTNPLTETKGFDHIGNIPPGMHSIFEPDAGFVLPEETIRQYSKSAQEYGAVIRYREPVVSWSEGNSGFEVKTNSQTFSCQKLVFTAGSWTSKLIRKYIPDLKVTEQLLTWFFPQDQQTFDISRMPCWFISDKKFGLLYGFPGFTDQQGNFSGVKMARHLPGEIVDPDKRSFTTNHAEMELIRQFVSAYFPKLRDAVVHTKNCLYTNSPDENFIIDFLPEANNNILIACGFSGHGFKFVPVIGEIIADMIEKKSTDLPVDFLSLKRFV
ncbi:N-methyl-L-tryptophan oxidase [Pollutibacter soli]|uniref:N-methyl-L-tryptophan oxidase n=1 Tax=Pollutibacter soli TaxID=3034157 RepID=UPI003013BFCC